MTTAAPKLRTSDRPIFVQFREYMRLRDQDELILRGGKHYAIRGGELRPVHIQWSRY